MVSSEEAGDLLKKTKDLANCDPEEYYRDFLLCREPEEDQGEYNIEKVNFHSNIQTELNINLTEQIQSLLSDIGKGDEEEDNEPAREIIEYNVDHHDQTPVPIQYISEERVKGDLEHYDRFRGILNDQPISDETDFSYVDDVPFQVFRIKTKIQPKLVAFRSFTRNQIVGSNFRVKVTTTGTQEYNVLRENPVALPDVFDAVYYNRDEGENLYFVFNPGNFEKILDYFEVYEQDAQQVFSHIESSELNIAEFDRLKDTVMRSNGGLRKMRQIRKRGKYNDLTRDRVEEIISEWNLSIYVGEDDDGNWQIHIPDFRKVSDVLGLLDDDVVVSGIDNVSDTEEEQKYFAKGGKEAR